MSAYGVAYRALTARPFVLAQLIKGALEAEEYLRRDAFEAELREAIRGEFEQLRADAQMQYTGALRDGFTQLRQGLDAMLGPTPVEPGKTFVPARSIGGQGD